MDFPNIRLLSFVILFVFSIGSVFALGVSAPFWGDDHPLKIAPGTTEDIEFTLVNRADAETEEVVVTMLDDGGVAEITSGTDYTVAPGTINTKVGIRVTIPADANIGDSHNVRFLVSSPTNEDGGTVQIGINYEVEFPVEIVSESDVPEPTEPVAPTTTTETTKGSSTTVWIVVVIVLALIVWWFMKKKRTEM